MLQRMVPWLQRGNLEEISLKPNHPAVVTHFPLSEAVNSETTVARLVKRGRRLFLVIDKLEINMELQEFQSDSRANILMNYLLEQRPGEIINILELPDSIHEISGLKLRDTFRKMHHWKAFEKYFMLKNTKQDFGISNQIFLTPLETNQLLKAFNIKWQEPEQTSK